MVVYISRVLCYIICNVGNEWRYYSKKERENMTDSEKLDLILSEIKGIKSEMAVMKSDIAELKSDVAELKSEMAVVKSDIAKLKAEMKEVKSDIAGLKAKMAGMESDITDINLHLENKTDHGLKLLAENFVELTKKLNAAIPAADRNLAYEVKVDFLGEEVEKLKRDVAIIQGKIA